MQPDKNDKMKIFKLRIINPKLFIQKAIKLFIDGEIKETNNYLLMYENLSEEIIENFRKKIYYFLILFIIFKNNK